MPLSVFIEIYEDNDLQKLIIQGEVSEKELQRVWLDINSEFLEISGDANAVNYATKMLKLNRISARIVWVKMVLVTLRSVVYQPMIDALIEEDFGVTLDYSNLDQFNADLAHIEVCITNDEIEAEEIQAQLDEEDKKSAGETVTEKFNFEEILFEINHVEKVVYRIKDLTVKGFALLLKRLKKPKRVVPE